MGDGDDNPLTTEEKEERRGKRGKSFCTKKKKKKSLSRLMSLKSDLGGKLVYSTSYVPPYQDHV